MHELTVIAPELPGFPLLALQMVPVLLDAWRTGRLRVTAGPGVVSVNQEPPSK